MLRACSELARVHSGILDSCYSGLATRGSETAQRSVEIIASVDAQEQTLGNLPLERVRAPEQHLHQQFGKRYHPSCWLPLCKVDVHETLHGKDLLIGHIASSKHGKYGRMAQHDRIAERDVLAVEIDGLERKSVQRVIQTSLSFSFVLAIV